MADLKGPLMTGHACATCGQPGRAHWPWIPIEQGEMGCCCCGLYAGGETAECGKHHYCGICVGRGHDKDHDCTEYDSESAPFDRMQHDCPACGERHLDWERCDKVFTALQRAIREKCDLERSDA
jgi:hypothetical protein